MRLSNVLILSVIFCVQAYNVRGENKLDETVESNYIVEKEIRSLEEEIEGLNNSISCINNATTLYSETLAKVTAERDFLKKETDEKELKKEIELNGITNTNLEDKIKAKESQLEEIRCKLKSLKSDIAEMKPFSDVKKQLNISDNISYIQKRFSEIDMAQLLDLKNSATDFSSMKDYVEYVKRLDYAIQNKDVYDDGMRAINSPFDEDLIVSIRERIYTPCLVEKDDIESGAFKLTSGQWSELDSLDIKLSRFMDGIEVLKNTIKEINSNKEIESLRKANDAKDKALILELIDDYVNPKQGSKREESHMRYFSMVPYLEDLLNRYWAEINENPFVPTNTEKEIIKLTVEE